MTRQMGQSPESDSRAGAGEATPDIRRYRMLQRICYLALVLTGAGLGWSCWAGVGKPHVGLWLQLAGMVIAGVAIFPGSFRLPTVERALDAAQAAKGHSLLFVGAYGVIVIFGIILQGPLDWTPKALGSLLVLFGQGLLTANLIVPILIRISSLTSGQQSAARNIWDTGVWPKD
jgi:hypothetical protein